MRNALFLFLIVSLLGLAACSKNEEKPANNAPAGAKVVKVEDKIDASDYSYLQVSDKDGNKYWLAVTKIDAAKGDVLYYTKSMEMKNFHSNTLNRDFESVMFVDDIRKTPHNMDEKSSPHSQVTSVPKSDVKVEPLKDGKTIAQIYAGKESLNGKTVKVRGVVAKYNPEIMQRNWIHIQDGTGDASGYDLMVTSNDAAAVGETVVVEGTVILNKDFGAGYSYSVMIENAKVKVEKKM